MSLRRFLNVAFALLVEEYQRLGMDLLTALEKVGELGEHQDGQVPAVVAAASPLQNEQAMAALTGMLGGVQGAPKTPRRGAR